MALITKSTIQEVNDRLDAISIIGDYVRLEKKSGRWWGKCPFHAAGQEKTASFKVDPDLKMYHCFGCNKGGSVIGFVMEMDKLTYPEAVKTIAGKLGIEIVYEEGGPEKEDNSLKEELMELYRRTTGTFQHFLREKPEGKDALKYLSDRGISDEMIDRFKLGFAVPDRNFLFNFLKGKGYSPDFLEKSGLFSSNYKTMPLFTGRLMFPISDRQGRVVALGGRAMPGAVQNDGKEPPKYINSPETEIYKKGQTLYAIDLALPEIRQTKTVYLAEGYMDVIALHQAGITNAVAPLGTAYTDEQAALLHRWAEKVVLCLDNDVAGQKAAYKAIVTCRKNSLSCEVIVPEDAEKFKDPAEILQKFGSEVLKKVLKNTINDFEYLIFCGRSQFKNTEGAKNRAAAFLFPFLDALASGIERDDCIARLADAFLLDPAVVKEDYSKRKADRYESRRGEESQGGTGDPIRMNNELFLLTVVAVNMALYSELRATLEIKEIDDPKAKELFIAMEECFIHDESDIDSLLSRIKDDQLRKFIAGRGASPEFKGGPGCDPHRLMEDGIKEIKKKKLKNRLLEIAAEMRNSERAGEDSIDELLAEKKFIDSQIRKLEGR